MESSEFISFVDEILENLSETIEEADKDYVLDEIEFHDGVLNIILEDGRQYVINRHTPSRQIWLSSPVSGAGHFSYTEQQHWVDSKGRDLFQLLGEELKKVAGLNLPL